MEKYSKLQAGDKPIKIDKDLIEIQKTVIHYGDSILLELDKTNTLVRTILQKDQKEKKDKGPLIEISDSEKTKSIDKEGTDKNLVQLIRNMKIPK